MNKEEILHNYITLIKDGYCKDCNELNCIDNFPSEKIAKAIEELQQENKLLKYNWNKLKELLPNISKHFKNQYQLFSANCCEQILEIMQELESEDSNE